METLVVIICILNLCCTIYLISQKKEVILIKDTPNSGIQIVSNKKPLQPHKNKIIMRSESYEKELHENAIKKEGWRQH